MLDYKRINKLIEIIICISAIHKNKRKVGSYMTKNDFLRRIIISSVLTAIAIALIITFCVLMFVKYSYPSEENTSMASDTVADVYYAVGADVVIVEMSEGKKFQLVYPNFQSELYSTIGYDLDELCNLLIGKEIRYLRMDHLPWIVEIYVDDIVINNNELTNKQIDVTRICIVIIGLIMLAFPICGDVAYIKKQYRCYKKSEKKRARKARRSLKTTP